MIPDGAIVLSCLRRMNPGQLEFHHSFSAPLQYRVSQWILPLTKCDLSHTRVPNRFEKIGFSVFRFTGFASKPVYRFFGLSVFQENRFFGLSVFRFSENRFFGLSVCENNRFFGSIFVGNLGKCIRIRIKLGAMTIIITNYFT